MVKHSLSPLVKKKIRKRGFSQITMHLLIITLRYIACGLVRVLPLPSTVYIDPLLGSRSHKTSKDIMVTLYFHHNYFPTTRERDFILVLHAYLTQSHTLAVLCLGPNFWGTPVSRSLIFKGTFAKSGGHT